MFSRFKSYKSFKYNIVIIRTSNHGGKMTKLSSLISKPVISLYNCECIGFVYNALFDKQTKSLRYLIILDETNDIEYALNTKNILNASNDALIIKNSDLISLKQSLELELSNYENIVLKNTYSIDGNALGNVKDIELDEKFKISNIETNITTIPYQNIIKIDNIILGSDRKVNINRYKSKPKFSAPTNYTVTIQSSTPKMPTKASINEDLLLNRTVYNSILDSQNNILIKQNTIINNSVIELAKKHGKLKELIRYSF